MTSVRFALEKLPFEDISTLESGNGL